MGSSLRCPRALLKGLLTALLLHGSARAEDLTLAERVTQLEAQLHDLASRQDPTARALPLRLNGFVQVDAAVYRQDSEDQLDEATGQPLNETRFLIRRARLRAVSEWRYLGAALELDGSTVQGAQARLLGAEVWAQWPALGVRPPYVQLAAGLFKIPFGREVLQYDPERLFLERSQMVRAFFPGEYDLGLRAQGSWRFLRYALSGMNGAPAGEQMFSSRDPNRSKDLLGRLGIEGPLGRAVRLRAGVSGLWGTGFSPGSASTKDVLVWRDDNDDGQVQPSEIQAVRGRAARPSENFSRSAVGADAELTVTVPALGALELSAEVIVARNLDRGLVPADPIAAGRDLRELGYYVGVTQFITPYARIGLRFDSYDPDADRQEQIGSSRVPVSTVFSTLTVTASVQHPRFGRLSLQYENNRNSLGRSPSGMPTTLGRDAVILRAQGSF